MNLALLSKMSWYLATDSNRLWAQVMKSKYYAGSLFFRCHKKKNASWTWSSILASRRLILNGLCYRVGKGNRTNIWEDCWILNNIGFKVVASGTNNEECRMVESLRHANGEWDVQKLCSLFDSITIDNILKIPYLNRHLEDTLKWVGNSNGLFSFKSSYSLAFCKNTVTSS